MKKATLLLLCVIMTKSALSVFIGTEQFRYEEIDYTNAPVYKQIKKHPEKYEYLKQIKLYRINYLSDGLNVTGLMAAPAEQGNYPVVIFNRGGNREFGSLLIASGTDILAPIAADGYVVVASNYRGNSGGEGVEEFGGGDVMDVINLAKYCSVYPDADTSKMAMMGVSRGAMMNYITLRIAEKSGVHFECAVSIGGISDLEKTIEYHPEIGTVCEEIIPDFNTNRLNEIQKRSAIYWVNEIQKNCPLLILHSYEDASVTYLQIPAFADSLDKYQVPYQLISYKKDNHGIIKHQQHVREQINNWFNQYLKNNSSFTIDEKRIIIE